MNYKERKYVIIIPARNEEKYIEKTIQSLATQTIVPEKLVIVNDGSTDNTEKIVTAWAKKKKWIQLINRQDRGFRQAGIGVMQAFYAGYSIIEQMDWDFIVKLDADLNFDKNYFESCFKEFYKNPKLGIGGGTLYSEADGTLIFEKNPAFHIRGATKIIRKRCWEDIGGFVKITGWDTLDEVKANMLGWETYSFPDVILYQQRVTGAAAGSWKNLVKNGQANYICGYHPFFMLMKCLRRIFVKPYFLGCLGLLYGYVSGFINKTSKIEDHALIQYLQNQQLRRLFHMESIWK